MAYRVPVFKIQGVFLLLHDSIPSFFWRGDWIGVAGGTSCVVALAEVDRLMRVYVLVRCSGI